MKRKRIVVLTGAGISAESGIPTFRGADGLWEGHRIEDVASPEGWERNPALVLEFYNQRRKNAIDKQPNTAHLLLAELEKYHDVTIITQNVDNLHEKAGSTRIIHLHGELFKVRSTADDTLVYDLDGWELKLGDRCQLGSQLRPHIVWFGEMVPLIADAAEWVGCCQVFIVVGTSLQVYPAAGLLHYVPEQSPIYIIDPNMPALRERPNLHAYEMSGSEGMKQVFEALTGVKP